MQEVRCIKCGRSLRDPESIVTVWVPHVPASRVVIEEDTAVRVRLRGSSSYAAYGHGSADTPTLFSLVEEDIQPEEQQVVEEVSPRKSGLAEILMQFPTDLVDLVLSAPAAGAITWHLKNYSNKKKPEGSIPPGRILQEIRRMCIDLRLRVLAGHIPSRSAGSVYSIRRRGMEA